MPTVIPVTPLWAIFTLVTAIFLIGAELGMAIVYLGVYDHLND